MPSSTDYMFLTTSMQKIMLLMYQNREITFADQEVFKSRAWFRLEMRKLERFDKIEIHNGISASNMNKKVERYVLTFTGKIFVEKYIFDFNKAIRNE